MSHTLDVSCLALSIWDMISLYFSTRHTNALVCEICRGHLLVCFVPQVLQDKVAATSQKVSELEAQLSAERERAVNGEEHGRTLARQLAEQQQESAQLAKKREGSEAELASQVILSVSRSTG